MKKMHHYSLYATVTFPLILLLFAILAIQAVGISPEQYTLQEAQVVEEQRSANTSSSVFLTCARHYTLLHYESSSATLKNYPYTNINTSSLYNYTKFEWILQHEGNNQYSIRYAPNPSYVLTYTDTSTSSETIACIEQVTSNLLNKHLWTFDYANGENIIGGDGTTKIKNVANGEYLFARDNNDVELRPDWSDNDADAVLWFIDYSMPSGFSVATSIKVNYDKWVDVDQSINFNVTLYPANGYRCAFPDDFIVEIHETSIASFNSDFSLLSGHQSGSTYITIKHKYSNLATRIPITVGQIISDGVYYISNRESGGFMDTDNGASNNGTPVQESSLVMTLYQAWNIKYEGNGFYSIRSNSHGKYVSLALPMPVNAVNIVLSSTLNDSSLWRIVQTTQGAYSLFSKYGYLSNYAVRSHESEIDGQDLTQGIYIDDYNYYDEWYIISNGSTLYSPNVGIVFNQNYLFYNVISSRYLSVANGNITTSTNKYAWFIDSQGSYATNGLSRLKNDSGYFITFNGTSIALNTSSSQYLTIKRFNAKPFDGTYVIIYNNKYLKEDPVTHELSLVPYFSESCLWSIKTSDNKTANYFYPSDYSSQTYETVSDYLTSAGYNTASHVEKDAQYAHSLFPNSNIFIFRGHAGPGGLQFSGSQLRSYVSISPHYSITNYSNTNPLSLVDMAFFLGCSSGLKPKYHSGLIEVAYEQGVHFVIGTYDTVYAHHSNRFLEYLMDHLKEGNNLKESIKYAQDSFYDYYEVEVDDGSAGIPLESYGIKQIYYPIIFVGDIYQKL